MADRGGRWPPPAARDLCVPDPAAATNLLTEERAALGWSEQDYAINLGQVEALGDKDAVDQELGLSGPEPGNLFAPIRAQAGDEIAGSRWNAL